MTMLEDRPRTKGPQEHSDPLVPIFVYGTLRVGQGNYTWAKQCVRHEIIECVAQGRIYFVGPYGGFPVARFDQGGRIVGDVLYCDPAERTYDEMVQMELGAGYESREIEVVTPDGDTLECLAFHYLYEPRGSWIPSGDWVNAKPT